MDLEIDEVKVEIERYPYIYFGAFLKGLLKSNSGDFEKVADILKYSLIIIAKKENADNEEILKKLNEG